MGDRGVAHIRIGQGFDVHRWGTDRSKPLVLGGVSLADHPGVVSHSDGDVVAHACTDAVLGAIGLGDIGGMFPDSDPALAGADSIELLTRAVAAVDTAGWEVVNIDCTVVLDAPKISPIRDEMVSNLSGAAGAPVTVKGKRTEGLESLSGGPHCWAVALLQRRPSAVEERS
jgi:2-C-methyl-D-erythritol 2,4-cyclodiphosphate synthase